MRPDLKPLLDQILSEVPATDEIKSSSPPLLTNSFLEQKPPCRPASWSVLGWKQSFDNPYLVQCCFENPPEANPTKLPGSVRFSPWVDQDICQLETPLVFSLDNCKCRILKWVSPSGSRCNIQSSLTLSTATAAFSSTSSSPPPSSTHLNEHVHWTLFRSWCRLQKIPTC